MRDAICRWVADRLPRRVVYFCGVRLWVHATKGKYNRENVGNTAVVDALERWEEKE
jgi:hypothetical protein